MMKRNLIAAGCAVLLAGVATTAGAVGRPDLVSAGLANGAAYRSGEMLVQFQRGISSADQRAVLAKLGATPVQMLRSEQRRSDRGGDLQLVRFPVSMSIDRAMTALQGLAAVDFAEPNWIYQHDATSNDPYYTNGTLWGMYGASTTPSNVYGVGAGTAWAAGKTCNSGMYVGIIDEGFMYDHEDLAANSWTNPYDPVDGIDNDGNGYIDDVHGWDFDGDDNSTFDGTTDEHGTHVSGTIAGVGGNGKGVAGVCWSATLISAKFLGRRGGTTANAVLAVDYMTDLKLEHGLNLVATNNSWGGGGFSQSLADAIERAGDADILFIAAAGNDGVNNDSSAHYPGSYDNANIISVASIEKTGAISSFSNYGATSVDIGAPGGGITSTVPARSRGSVVSGYASYSGTSMATPHVSGAALLYASTHPGATALQIRQGILDSAIPTSSLTNKVATGGRLDVSGY